MAQKAYGLYRKDLDSFAFVPGRVASGRGIAQKHLERDAEKIEIENLIGHRIYPGTLNVLLHRPIQITQTNAYDIALGRRYICPAHVADIRVWIHRWPYTPLHVAELISNVRLRDELKLYGDEHITLKIDKNNLDSISFLSTAVWAACWKYREDLYYRSETYHRNIGLGRLQRFFGACQHP